MGGGEALVIVLLIRSALHLCALPLPAVRETVRMLPCLSLPGAPDYVLGLSRVRGRAVAVVDLGRLMGESGGAPRRLVSLRAGDRSLALAVEDVIGIRPVEAGTFSELPSLLRSCRVESVVSIGEHDQELLLVLDAARLVPAEHWERLAREIELA